MKRGLIIALLGGVIAALALGPAGAASASLGSVPAEVSAYVASGGLVSRLADIYGKNKDGSAGLPFGDTTTAGPISRVYQWTTARLANTATDHPVQLTNNWVVPISIGSKPVGLATIWINPQTVVPELADFDPSVSTAVALGTIPADAALVRDSATHAWLALAAGTVTPLVAGTSGLSTPAPVASLKLSATAAAPAAAADPNTGLVLAIGLVALVVVIVAVALLWPRRTPRKAGDAGSAAAASGDTTRPKTAPTVEPEPEPEPAPVPVVPAPVPVPPPAPRAAASRPSSPVTKPAPSKPAGSKPAGRTATTAATSAKPRVQKPPVQKPPVQKPPVSEPATPRKAAESKAPGADPTAATEAASDTPISPAASKPRTPRAKPTPKPTEPEA